MIISEHNDERHSTFFHIELPDREYNRIPSDLYRLMIADDAMTHDLLIALLWLSEHPEPTPLDWSQDDHLHAIDGQ
jgi:hypothetical protein